MGTEHASGDESDRRREEAVYASRVPELEGGTIAYVDWGKPNGEELYESFAELFSEEFGLGSLEYFRKPSSSSPIPSDVLEEILAVDPDGVILAIADCGSCNSSVVGDAITFETRDIPTVQVITDAFLDLNDKVSESYGYERLPRIAVEHPTRYLDDEEVHELAQDIMGAVYTSLTSEECLVAETGAVERSSTG